MTKLIRKRNDPSQNRGGILVLLALSIAVLATIVSFAININAFTRVHHEVRAAAKAGALEAIKAFYEDTRPDLEARKASALAKAKEVIGQYDIARRGVFSLVLDSAGPDEAALILGRWEVPDPAVCGSNCDPRFVPHDGSPNFNPSAVKIQGGFVYIERLGVSLFVP